jgi:hypothetical protein
MEWLAVVSARKFIKPDKITIYTDGQQDSCWWRRIAPYIDHQIILSMPGTSVLNGVKIEILSHMSDFLRFLILYHNGGIYMDTDVLILKSFDPLLQHQMVASEECGSHVGTAVMMSQKHSCVMCRFAHLSCEMFNGGWATHAVQALTVFMKNLDKEKEGVLVLPLKKGCLPLCWDGPGVERLYRTDAKDLRDYNISELYSVHLYRHFRTDLLLKTVNNYKWIQTSKSLAANAVRGTLPHNFSIEHLDENACIALPEY